MNRMIDLISQLAVENFGQSKESKIDRPISRDFDMSMSMESLDGFDNTTSPYQLENQFNKLLPYADKLDLEADNILADIKAKLGKCVLYGDVSIGLYHEANNLCKYICLYGLRFTKEEHVALVKLFYELIIIPDLEPLVLDKFASILYILLRKEDLLSRNDLELPWKPLFDLCRTILKRKIDNFFNRNMHRYHADSEEIMKSVVEVSKLYFPISATQEILDEIRPNLYPAKKKFVNYMTLLQWFLPVYLPVEHHNRGHELWFHELMKYWEVQLSDKPVLENKFMYIMAKLASNNIGYIDWNPYIPMMFTRFLQSLNLPVMYKQNCGRPGPYLDQSLIAEWIASVLGDQSNAQIYLEKFLKTIETYFHPANSGSWSLKLNNILNDLSFHVSSRLFRERHKKETWKVPIPDSHKLTNANVDAFVSSVMPVTTIAIFNFTSGLHLFGTIQKLAAMRPNLVIPRVLEKLYPVLTEDSTERNKLSCVFSLLSSMLKPLALGSRYFDKEYAYHEGPADIINFLYAALSALNVNEPENCFSAINFIKNTFALIPIVDCSKSKLDKSTEDYLIFEQTARFEDFILHFMDKIFSLIKLVSHVSVRIDNNAKALEMDSSEVIIKKSLYDTFLELLQHMSKDLFVIALNKLKSFVQEETFEVKVSGQIVAIICEVFSSKNGELVLHSFVPYLCPQILSYFEEHSISEEQLENQLLYPLLILNYILVTQGSAILTHLDNILSVIDKVLTLESEEINKLSCNTLKIILSSLCNVHVIGDDKIDDKDFPHWEDWGKSLDVKTAHLTWYVPGEKELDATREIFKKYFIPATNKIQNFVKEEILLSRRELTATLRIIYSCLDGCDSVLPHWNEELMLDKRYENCDKVFSPVLGVNYEITTLDGSNVKRFMVQVMSELQVFMLNKMEDNTECFNLLLRIWKTLGCHKDLNKLLIAQSVHDINIMRKVSKMNITDDKGITPSILTRRVFIQHRWRKSIFTENLTPTSGLIIMNLLQLSKNKYREISLKAVDVLKNVLDWYQFAHESSIMIPDIVNALQSDTEANEDAYAGILSVLKHLNILLRQKNWQNLSSLISAMVLAKPTEKLQNIHLLEKIVQQFKKQFLTVNFVLNVPDSCVDAARKLWKVGLPPSETEPDEITINSKLTVNRNMGRENLQTYYALLDELVNALLSKKLHWRHYNMATEFMSALVHPDHLLPSKVVKHYLYALIHDSIDERQLALKMVTKIMFQLKRKHSKITIQVPSTEGILRPGIRADNEWLLYDPANWPTTAEKWDSPRYVHKLSIGYCAWPKKLEIYAPCANQPTLDRAIRQLSDQEKEVDAFFDNDENVAQLIKCLSMEGKVQKIVPIFIFYKLFEGLFRNHGDDHLDRFLSHLSKLVTSTCEHSQRCAAGIISGLIRATKHWPFDKTKAMCDKLIPIIKLVFDNASNETVTDWATCFQLGMENRDPNRLFWLIEFMKDELLKDDRDKSTINEITRFYVFKNIMDVNYWRMSLWLCRLLPEFKAYLSQYPLKGVRDCLNWMLFRIYNAYICFNSEEKRPEYPMLNDFLNSDQLLLKNLLDDNNKNGLKIISSLCFMMDKWNLPYVIEGGNFYNIYPTLIRLENRETQDPELAKIVTQTITFLATSTYFENIPAALEAINKTSRSYLWSDRINTINFVEVFLFYNMNLLLSNQSWIDEIRSIVLKLLEDERVEVREKAADVLSGMLHCTLINDREALLDKFVKMANNKKSDKTKESKDSLRLRHVGILGMCAFIKAHPYDIPEDVPPIFDHLRLHLNESVPIMATIRETMSDFKRTHCDTTAGVQGLTKYLTPEQFESLQFLNLTPSYFS